MNAQVGKIDRAQMCLAPFGSRALQKDCDYESANDARLC